MPLYLLLHRAIRNAGDFLIFERALALLSSRLPGADFRIGLASEHLAGQFSTAEIAAARAIIVCGGPGYQRRMYPGVYPLLPLSQLRIPVVLMALGSFYLPDRVSSPSGLVFDGPSMQLLRAITAAGGILGARDILTAELLRGAGFDQVLMTGDPAWYDLEHIDDPFTPPGRPVRLAFTPPANPLFFAQSFSLLEGMAEAVGATNITIVFHRDRQKPFDVLARRVGMRTIDITGSAAGFMIYEEHDAHIGYRVHAHLYCLSRGKVSYLVAEDSRGVGMLRTLGPLGSDAVARAPASSFQRLAWSRLPRVASPRHRSVSWIGPMASRMLRMPSVTDEVMVQLSDDQRSGFHRHFAAIGVIRSTLPVMNRMIEAIPG
jgi:hypothetical protein